MYKFKKTEEKPITDVLPITECLNCKILARYTRNDEYLIFKNSNQVYFDLLQITTKDLNNMSDANREFEVANWIKFYRVYSDDLKIISINFPADVSSNLAYYRYLNEKAKNPVKKRMLQTDIERLERFNQDYLDLQFYLMVFGNSEDELLRNMGSIQSNLMSKNLVKFVDNKKKKKLLFNFFNKNVAIYDLFEDNSYDFNTDDKEDFLSAIQPQGGISFVDESLVQTGTGYEACIRIHKYPKEIGLFWLSKVMNIPGAIVTLDIYTEDKSRIIKNINKSFQNQDELLKAASKLSDYRAAQSKQQELINLLNEISELDDSVKNITTRIFVSHYTKEGLEEDIAAILKTINDSESFKGCIDLNETENNWKSIVKRITDNKNDNKLMARVGQAITAGGLSKGLPFHFTSLLDSYGGFLGVTKATAGPVLFNPFTVNMFRTSYNGVVYGNMGAGKSTFLKVLAKMNYEMNNNTIVFDFMNDFTSLAKEVGGIVLYFDGTNKSVLNILEITASVGIEGTIKDFLIFKEHLSKCAVWLSHISNDLGNVHLKFWQNALREFYSYWGFVTKEGEALKPLVGQNPTDYPILSDFVKWATEIYEKEIHLKTNEREKEKDLQLLDDIVRELKIVILNHGNIFNRHTSIKNVFGYKFIVFNFVQIKNQDRSVLDPQVYTALTMAYGHATTVGSEMKRLYGERKIKWFDIVRTMIIIDEAHILVNSNKPAAVKQILSIIREDRHIFTGIWMATQSIRDQAKGITLSGNLTEAQEDIATMLDLSQYKFIFKQDEGSIEIIKRLFANQITNDELRHIPKYEKGECLMITGAEKLEAKVKITSYEEHIFDGGA